MKLFLIYSSLRLKEINEDQCYTRTQWNAVNYICIFCKNNTYSFELPSFRYICCYNYLVSAIFVAMMIFLTPSGGRSNTSRWLTVGIMECSGIILNLAAKIIVVILVSYIWIHIHVYCRIRLYLLFLFHLLYLLT